ncbi:MAG: lipase chaperone [Polyangiaceae bacterium]|nr:lipase chaperone [Polyangiaceae bacterium]
MANSGPGGGSTHGPSAQSRSADLPTAAVKPRTAVDSDPAKLTIARPTQQVALPRSLEGTDVDGGYDVDGSGHLVLGPRVIALFDYFFSASGEESETALRARIEEYTRAALSEPALGEALSLLDRYMAYRAAGRGVHLPPGAGAAERLQAIRDLRRKHFGADADALFGIEERMADAALAKSAAQSDSSLSADEKEDSFAQADLTLTEAAREARAQATSILTLRADEAALRADGAGEDAIARYREAQWGTEAAGRLAELDRKRAAFQARVEAYREERNQQCQDPAGAAACEAALLEERFDARERIRVRVLTRAN